MPLVLALRKGHDFYVEDVRVVVSYVDNPYTFGVRVHEALFRVSDTKSVEIMPGVQLTASVPKNQNSSAVVRVEVTAPGKSVMRGDLYRRKCDTCKGKKQITIPVKEYTSGVLSTRYEKSVCPDCS